MDVLSCGWCRAGRAGDEIIGNYGVCDDCFEMDCPCTENKPKNCPLHRWPDVVLRFDA